ncbi:MAG TPA: DUF1232 domain-containing protein [Longimicrobiaceae bacterium]|nr:DUF1232 domain-containing protein [Longimicrobiaceae bacterium]
MSGGWRARWRARARELKAQTFALALAARDPRVPWYAKAVLLLVVGYALSPIDLIPDFVPVLGLLDDLLLLPLGILLAVRLIPPPVWQECLARARAEPGAPGPRSRAAAAVIVALWIAALALSAWLLWPAVRGRTGQPWCCG